VNVLVCEALHVVVDIVPSIAVIVVVLQPSVAVAEPRAASISEEEGLQPRVVVVPLAVMDGPLRSRIHVTVVEAVAVLPQASVAINVLVLEALHDVVAIAPSLDVTDAVPQPSEAVAVPSAA